MSGPGGPIPVWVGAVVRGRSAGGSALRVTGCRPVHEAPRRWPVCDRARPTFVRRQTLHGEYVACAAGCGTGGTSGTGRGLRGGPRHLWHGFRGNEPVPGDVRPWRASVRKPVHLGWSPFSSCRCAALRGRLPVGPDGSLSCDRSSRGKAGCADGELRQGRDGCWSTYHFGRPDRRPAHPPADQSHQVPHTRLRGAHDVTRRTRSLR